MSDWKQMDHERPTEGKVIIVCNDGCSSSLALVTDEGLLDGEDGLPLTDIFIKGSLWTLLPDDYPLFFMERHDDY